MNWRVGVLGLTGVLTMVTAFGRFEDGKTGFLIWAPFLTSLFAFAAIRLMRRPGDAQRPNRRDGDLDKPAD